MSKAIRAGDFTAIVQSAGNLNIMRNGTSAGLAVLPGDLPDLISLIKELNWDINKSQCEGEDSSPTHQPDAEIMAGMSPYVSPFPHQGPKNPYPQEDNEKVNRNPDPDQAPSQEPVKQSSLTIGDLIRESYATAVNKGWWKTGRPFSEGIALMHSELSEALEEWRDHGYERMMEIGPDGKPVGLAVELADVLIRIADWCGRTNIPLEKALYAKLAYNTQRPHRHGGKLA